MLGAFSKNNIIITSKEHCLFGLPTKLYCMRVLTPSDFQ